MPHLPGGSKTVHRGAGVGGKVTYTHMHVHNKQIDEMTTIKMAEDVSMAEQGKTTKLAYWHKHVVHRKSGWSGEHCGHVNCAHRCEKC